MVDPRAALGLARGDIGVSFVRNRGIADVLTLRFAVGCRRVGQGRAVGFCQWGGKAGILNYRRLDFGCALGSASRESVN